MEEGKEGLTDSIRSVSGDTEYLQFTDMLHLASPWKTLQHKSANDSSEEGQVEPSSPRLQPPDKICSTMSHAQDEIQKKKICRAKATELFMFIKFMS